MHKLIGLFLAPLTLAACVGNTPPETPTPNSSSMDSSVALSSSEASSLESSSSVSSLVSSSVSSNLSSSSVSSVTPSSEASSSSSVASSTASSAVTFAGNATQGEALYSTKKCSACHANMGNGIFGAGDAKIDMNNLQHTTLHGLVNYIEVNMPDLPFSPAECAGSCAEDIAAYLATFVVDNNSSSEAASSSSAQSSMASSSSAAGTLKTIYAYNFGATDDFTDASGQVFTPEEFVRASAGQTTQNDGAEITGTEDDALYRTNRWGKWTMELPVTAGHYNVTIYTVEDYFDASGQRLIDIDAEGITLANGLDLFATSGKGVAHTISESHILVEDGNLSLTLDASIDNATASAILVTSSDGEKGEPPAVEPTTRNGMNFDAVTCGAAVSGDHFIAFGPSSSSYWGWDYINYPDGFGGINNADLKSSNLNTYDLQVNNQKAADADCNGDLTLRRTFVHKYYEDTHQHENGLGISDDDGLFPAWNTVESVVIDLKLGDRTFIPNRFDRHNGFATLSIDTGSNGNQVRLIDIDPNLHLGHWIRITIPAHLLGNNNPSKLQFVAELSEGQPHNGPRDFMEVDVTLHTIALKLK